MSNGGAKMWGNRWHLALVVMVLAALLPSSGLAPAVSSPALARETTSVDHSSHNQDQWADWLQANNINESTYGGDPSNPVAQSVTMPYSGGPILAPLAEASPQAQGQAITCAQAGASVIKTFNISAIDVTITINRWGDNDPQGKMYVLDENIAAVRAQETAPLPDRVTIGLRDDPIQPLVIRANVGECVTINFTNRLSTGRASMHVHGLDVAVASAGTNVGLNPDTLVDPGQTISYHWLIPNRPELEGAKVFHSHGDPRQQHAHGLFGTLNVEPRGSIYLNPSTGQPQKSGWEAIIVDPNGKDFREDTIIYHELGDEEFRLSDAGGGSMPLNDFIGVYRPGARALNYRSEPFFRRIEASKGVSGIDDESQSYGSYMHGDPPTPIPRGYVGDPTKRRIVHGGSERFHVEHLHGGSIRWRFDPTVESGQWGLPFDKDPEAQSLSQRLDSQSIGPTESYNAYPEGAAGGLQAGAGEFLFHCHFPQHYIGGMWTFWRVFDTLQNAQNNLYGQTLVELPDRAGLTPAAVNSVGLLGRQLPSGRTLTTGATTATTKNIDEWLRSVLPPQGVPVGYDASVWDWTAQSTPGGPLYLSEPEDTRTWANFSSTTPGQRREILFNPNNGRPAFPLLRPHLGKRPPFAPGRSGSPYLGEPDADHPDSLIPSGARRLQYTVVAQPLSITFNQEYGLTDPNGLLLVLDEDRDAILAGTKPREQLTIRANVGDGVDITYYSEEPCTLTLPSGAAFAKTNVHIHFVQFDTQASDGVISGMSYEQSVRPYRCEGAAGTGIRLTQSAAAGSNTLTVDDASTLKVNAFVGIGFGVATNQPNGFEFAQIVSKSGNALTLDRQLQRAHPSGQFVGVEFVRYQWYADVEEGTTFFHDHVFGIPGFGKALTGALVVEPRDSLWLDPTTGAPIRSGTKAIIQTVRQVAPGVPIQSFREFVLHQMNAITALDEQGVSQAEPGGFNMRTEPLGRRLGDNPDPSLVFSSVTHGDPATPVLRAYLGDLVAIRLINTSGHDMSSFHMAGHRFRLERFDPREAPSDSLSLGISERFDLFMTAGSVGLQAGDYVYMSGTHEKMMDGAWGLFRIHDTLQPDLLPLRIPGPPSGAGFPQLTQTGGRPPAASEPASVADAITKLQRGGQTFQSSMPVRTFDVVAIEVPEIVFSQNFKIDPGRVYVLAGDEAAVRAGTKPLEPLVLRANVGEVVRVNFTNKIPGARASFHIPELIQSTDSQGSAVGFNRDSTVAPQGSITQWYVIDPRFEVSRSFAIMDFGDPVNGPASGLYGAFVVMPAGSTFHDPVTGVPVSSGVVVDVRNPSLPGGGFRDVALIFHDDDPIMNRDVMPYRSEMTGVRGINYKAAPLEERLGQDPAASRFFKTEAAHGDPSTTLIRAVAGEQVRLHVVGGPGHQAKVFSLEGERWPFDPSRPNNSYFSSRQFAPWVTIDAVLDGGAGSGAGVGSGLACPCSGDFLYQDHRGAFVEGGLWGILRVTPPYESTLLPLKDLSSGWNLVSRHVLPANTSPAQFLASIAGKFDMVAALDPNDITQWQTFSPSAAQNTLAALDQTKGFWIHMTEAAFLAPAGTLPAQTNIPLNTGWNLVGWPSLKTATVQQALASIAGKFDMVFAYDASDVADPWKKFDPAAPAYASDLFYLRPLLGYWIHMTQPGTLTVVNP